MIGSVPPSKPLTAPPSSRPSTGPGHSPTAEVDQDQDHDHDLDGGAPDLYHVSFRLSDADITRIDGLAVIEGRRKEVTVSRTAMLRILIRDRARKEGIS